MINFISEASEVTKKEKKWKLWISEIWYTLRKSIAFMFQKINFIFDNRNILRFIQNFCDQNITIQNEAKREAIEVTVTALSKLYKGWLKISWIVAFPVFFVSLVFCFKVFTSIDRVIKKQPPKLSYEKSCSQKFRKIHQKTPVAESYFW